jgi:NADPH:quinone reductase-like Zn-dependent oxidoreductase
MTERRTARAYWVVSPGRSELRDVSLPSLMEGDVEVRALRSGISRGTEGLVFRGEVPASQYHAMRCPFQEGDFPWPVKYGYASVGLVELGASDLIGRRVFCLHPHQDRYVVPMHAVTIVPDAVTDARAVLAANMETAINGLWDAALHLGDRVSVVGAGTVGCLVAALAARIPGAEVEIVDIDPMRAALARRLGCSFATPEHAARERDLVVHTSGNPQGLVTALSLTGFEATVLEMSWYGNHSVELPLGEAFHSRRLQIRSSQVGHVATAQRARWNHRRRMTLALRLLEDPLFDALLSSESAFEALPATMAGLALHPRGALCHVVTYS